VEIKCPFCTKDSDPVWQDFLNMAVCQLIATIYYQIQTQMMACETYFADFAVCSFPDGILKILIQRIEYDIAT